MYNNCNGDHPPPEPNDNIYLEIVEQPAPKTLRFRYQCEGRSAGSIPGINSTAEKKTFPSIRVVGYSGPVVVVVSCVTKDKPYRPHPHNLVGKEVSDQGVLTKYFNSMHTFNNLGIQCVRRNEVESSLNMRESLLIDPFRTGYGHRAKIKDLDLNAVRLCFQTFLKKKPLVPLKPIVSEPIYDKKANTDLILVDLSDTSSSVHGGKKIIILCEKVVKEDIAVRFYEELDGVVVWEAFGEFNHKNVHRQTAISFKTPKYKLLDIEHSVNVFVQLQRPSDKVTSEPLNFEFTPDQTEISIKRKRRRSGDNAGAQYMYNCLAENERFLDMQDISQPRANGLEPLFNDPNLVKTKVKGASLYENAAIQQLNHYGGYMPYTCPPNSTIPSFPPTNNNPPLAEYNIPPTNSPVPFSYNIQSSSSSHLTNWNITKNTVIDGGPMSSANQYPMAGFVQPQQNIGAQSSSIAVGGSDFIAHQHDFRNLTKYEQNHLNQALVEDIEIDSMTDSFSKLF